MTEKETLKTNDRADDGSACEKYRPVKEYTTLQVFADNLPYLIMVLLGIAICLVGSKFSLPGIGLGAAYVIYGIVGALWIIIFVCPYCQYYDTKSCPCGYGKIAAKFRNKSPENRFSGKFKKHIPVIVPLWILPLVAGIIFLTMDFNLLMIIFTAAFVLNSFVILPLTARIYGCGHCPQKEDCPWMRKEKERSAKPSGSINKN
jgi:hypothetical protein